MIPIKYIKSKCSDNSINILIYSISPNTYSGNYCEFCISFPWNYHGDPFNFDFWHGSGHDVCRDHSLYKSTDKRGHFWRLLKCWFKHYLGWLYTVKCWSSFRDCFVLNFRHIKPKPAKTSWIVKQNRNFFHFKSLMWSHSFGSEPLCEQLFVEGDSGLPPRFHEMIADYVFTPIIFCLTLMSSITLIFKFMVISLGNSTVD